MLALPQRITNPVPATAQQITTFLCSSQQSAYSESQLIKALLQVLHQTEIEHLAYHQYGRQDCPEAAISVVVTRLLQFKMQAGHGD
jgi:hypothetical protein